MNKSMKMMGVASVVLASVLISTGYLSAHPMDLAMFDQGHHPHHMMHKPRFDQPGHHRERNMMRELAQLDLSKEQRKQLQTLMDEKRKTMHEEMRTKRETRQALREAMIAEPYNADKVRQLAEAQGERVTARILKKAETRQQILAVLTDEQRAKLDSLRSEPRCKGAID